MSDTDAACPCGGGLPYEACCAPLHAGHPAPSAQALMRSRFSAFALGMPDYLMSSWHPATRPSALEPEPETSWRRLQIVDTVAGGPQHDSGIVEFRASYRSPEGAGVLHERSRFTRLGGRWVYVDGDILEP